MSDVPKQVLHRRLVALDERVFGEYADESIQDFALEDLEADSIVDALEQIHRDLEQIHEELAKMQMETVTDGGDKPYEQLERDEKVNRIRVRLVEQALDTPRGTAKMEYSDVYWLFDANPSKGHVYDLMRNASTKDGFEYQTFEEGDRNYRLVLDLDELNDESLVHAANTRPEDPPEP